MTLEKFVKIAYEHLDGFKYPTQLTIKFETFPSNYISLEFACTGEGISSSHSFPFNSSLDEEKFLDELALASLRLQRTIEIKRNERWLGV